jgi:polyferredoxin
MDDLVNALNRIEERNKRVEADKAWETSWTRRLFLALLTYIIAVLVLSTTGVENVWTAAVFPPLGYVISTLSLPPLKRFWMKKNR